jgi:hypothetical protein
MFVLIHKKPILSFFWERYISLWIQIKAPANTAMIRSINIPFISIW